ncbi:UDP-xylose transporter 3 [Vitis vinifera]|uniref:UDP-xylose transporter 3 n=1 Tax=Vitis vinifera TaxID=29760 RepID=A0A438F9A4_VITVI|nr:UDP-xylose transporter 3 [Vitis vinifera]
MGESQRFQLGTVGALSLSVVSSVSIVICNKALISSLGFSFGCTVIAFNLMFALALLWHITRGRYDKEANGFTRVCRVMWRMEAMMYSSNKDGEAFLKIVHLALNSLGFNSVGFYQMTKLAIIPCTVLLETLFFRKRFSRSIQLSLSILLLGVGIATVTDLQLNALGSVLSLLAVITTCIAQIMTNNIQKKFKVSSTQLLYQSCPYQAMTLFIAGPFLDWLLTKQNVFAFKYTSEVLVFIVLSCLISVSVNFSTFLVIGEDISCNIPGPGTSKTCLILAFGYVLLHDPFSWRNILGILIALIGMVLYSYYCSREGQQKPSEVSAQMAQAKESETDPLIGVENGAGILTDAVVAKVPAWNSKQRPAGIICFLAFLPINSSMAPS